MAHTHHCETCKVPVGICTDEGCVGQDAKGHFCTLHHPDPEYHRDLNQPSKRTVVTLPDSK